VSIVLKVVGRELLMRDDYAVYMNVQENVNSQLLKNDKNKQKEPHASKEIEKASKCE